MISERREFLDTIRKEEEQLVFLQMRKELLSKLLKNKYSQRDGTETDLRIARENALPSKTRTVKHFVLRVAGKEDEHTAKSGIRHNYAADLQEKIRADIPLIEREVRELIGLRAASAKALDDRRAEEETVRQELLRYIGTMRKDAKEALHAYEQADRELRLLRDTASSGHAFYTYLRALEKQLEGAAYTANRPIGDKPYFDILLQRAYTGQGEKWAESAESLQIAFLADLRTLDAMTPYKYRTAGQLAFSPLFFDTTLTKLLTLRKGDTLLAGLAQATDELATVLLSVEEAKKEAEIVRSQCAEGAGLVL